MAAVMDFDMEAKLQQMARGDSIDYDKWPDLLSRLIPRLEQIVHDEFPIPKLQPMPPVDSPSSSLQIQSQVEPSQIADTSSQTTSSSSQSTNKENAPPTTSQAASTDVDISPGSLPPQILSLVSSITQTMTTYFSKYPPHTMQRLSELLLNPKQHYRTLPSYLHAVDRVVHVTSGANIYPLPAAVPDAVGAKILSNGISTGTDPNSVSWGASTQIQHTLGSDESLGGALLTPIPWLRNMSAANNSRESSQLKDQIDGEVKTESTETIDGPNGPGGVETVSVSVNGISSTIMAGIQVDDGNGNGNGNGNGSSIGTLRAEGGVTQGELLRQEQRAGVVPASQLANSRTPDGDGAKSEEDEVPHARGPEEIGMEDMGPQAVGSVGLSHQQGMQGIDVEAAVGRRAEIYEEVKDEAETIPAALKREAEEELEKESKRQKEEEGGDDVDMVLVDADGRAADEEKVGEKGENIGADAIDTSTV